MPIYEFVCSNCGEEFEALVMGASHDIKCSKCGSGKVQKKMSVCAIKTGYKFTGTGKKASSGGCGGCSSSSCGSCGG